jgi:hypothetical protein
MGVGELPQLRRGGTLCRLLAAPVVRYRGSRLAAASAPLLRIHRRAEVHSPAVLEKVVHLFPQMATSVDQFPQVSDDR